MVSGPRTVRTAAPLLPRDDDLPVVGRHRDEGLLSDTSCVPELLDVRRARWSALEVEEFGGALHHLFRRATVRQLIGSVEPAHRLRLGARCVKVAQREVRSLLRAVGTPAAEPGGRRPAGLRARSRAGWKLADELGFDQDVDGGASLPRGVLALLGAGAVAHGGGLVQHQEHSYSPRGSARACRPTTIRCGRPSGRRGSTSSPTGAWSSVPACSTTWTELGGFGVDPDKTTKSMVGRVRARCCRSLWTEERVAHRERPCSMPERPRPAQAGAGAAPADVGHRDDAGHRARRRRPRASAASACAAGQLRGAGAPHARVPQAHRPVRSGELRRQRPGRHDELPLLPSGRRRGDRPSAVRCSTTFMLLNGHLLWTREVYPTAAYQSLANLAPGRRTRREREPIGASAGARRHRDRRPGPHRQGDQGVGGDRRGRRQLRAQHGGGDPAGGRAGVDAAVRLRGDAGVSIRGGADAAGNGRRSEAVVATCPARRLRRPSSPYRSPRAELLQVAWEVEAAARD